jgi:hypothetical protein
MRASARFLQQAAQAPAAKAVLLDVDAAGFATLTLNRGESHNTFSDEVHSWLDVPLTR